MEFCYQFTVIDKSIFVSIKFIMFYVTVCPDSNYTLLNVAPPCMMKQGASYKISLTSVRESTQFEMYSPLSFEQCFL